MNNNSPSNNRPQHRHGFSMRSLAMAAVIGMCGAAGSAAVHAQATAGNVFGKAPAGDTISAQSTTTGLQRQADPGDRRHRERGPAQPLGEGRDLANRRALVHEVGEPVLARPSPTLSESTFPSWPSIRFLVPSIDTRREMYAEAISVPAATRAP